MNTGLKNTVVIITGASGGIGGAIVASMLDEGAHVAIHFHRAKERAEHLARKANETGRTAIAVGADLTDEHQVADLFAQVTETLGVPQVCIANAGVWPKQDTALADMSLERWNQTVANNMTSVFLCAREFMRSSRANELTAPAMVVTGSTAGFFGEAGHADYAAAKSGLMYGLLKSLKNEFVQIAPLARINAVCPGWTVTPMTKRFAENDAAVAQAQQTIALRKFGKSEDIASAVTFLASNQLAGHITGQTLFVDGGMEGRILS